MNEFRVEPLCRVLHIAPSTWHEHARRKADPDRLPERAKRDVLKHIEANVMATLDAHLIVDNYAAHKHPKVRA